MVPNCTLAGRWMHARRPLFEAEMGSPETAEALDLIEEGSVIKPEAARLADGDEQAPLAHPEKLRAERSQGSSRNWAPDAMCGGRCRKPSWRRACPS